MIISLIAAMGKNRVIGKGNRMMWRLPLEWQYFKETTLNHCVLTGRKNILAQGRALPKRTNIVVTRDTEFSFKDCVIKHSIEDAIEFARSRGESELFICGGGEVYKQTIPIADRIYLTEVDYQEPGEVYFPEFDESKFDKTLKMDCAVSEDNPLAWKAFLYQREK